MSKKNNNHYMHLEMKQLIRDKQHEISRLQTANTDLHNHISSMRKGNQERFVGVMSRVYEHCVDGIISEEQASSLMLSLVGVWHHVCP